MHTFARSLTDSSTRSFQTLYGFRPILIFLPLHTSLPRVDCGFEPALATLRAMTRKRNTHACEALRC